MNPKELLVNMIMVAALLLVIRYPGYFKDWGIGKGGRKPYEENSPAYFYVRVGAVLALCLVLFFDLFLLLRFAGLDSVLTSFAGLFNIQSNAPATENKLAGVFVTGSFINCFWLLWYVRLWRRKEGKYSARIGKTSIFLLPFCLLTPMIMKVSFF